jgi:3',5'-cyclic AMP phosphodiesterase CpdA
LTRIAHISDIHFGKISHPTIVEALVRDINESIVDLVVVSGDLTQRAFGHQFRAAGGGGGGGGGGGERGGGGRGSEETPPPRPPSSFRETTTYSLGGA